MITAGIISHGHSNTLLTATETGEQWGTFKGGQMAGWLAGQGSAIAAQMILNV